MDERAIPIDSARVDESTLTSIDWAKADDAHERFKALLDVKPRARARYLAALAEINGDR